MTVDRASEASQRFDKRFWYRLAVELHWGRHSRRFMTENVSLGGIFLATEEPPDLRVLLRITMKLPPDDRELTAHGMAVHVVRAGAGPGATAGVGVQFYAVDGATRARWAEFIKYVERTFAPVPEALPEPPPRADRRQHPRTHAELELEVRSVEELKTLYTRDVSAGGMFIVTDLALAVGAPLRIQVVHPRTRARFPVDAVVRRLQHPSGVKGLGVEFVAMTDARRAEFLRFVRDSAGSGELRGPA